MAGEKTTQLQRYNVRRRIAGWAGGEMAGKRAFAGYEKIVFTLVRKGNWRDL
jgi:hypothetical protein